MKQKLRKVILGLSLQKLDKVHVRTLRDTARAFIQAKKTPPPLVIIGPKGRRFEFWDVDFNN